MTEQTRFDRALPGLFDELAAARTPDYLEAAIERASSRSQRPAWTYSGRWLPMQITTEAVPSVRGSWRLIGILALVGLLIALATVAYVGSRPTRPSPVLLARGSVVLKDWGPVEFEATREGSNVTGRMTIGLEDGTPADPEKGFVGVDFQCGRTTEDGLVAIGGYSTDGAGLTFRVHDQGTLFALVLRRGSPIAMQHWAGTLENMPSTQTTDCLAYLDAWLPEARLDVQKPRELRGAVELGP